MSHRRRLGSYAVAALLLVAGAACSPTPSESPAFKQVAVIEGFYGKPWSHQDRLDMIRFMGNHGFTHYYYTPKDDPLHRELWRKTYSGEALERFQEILQVSSDSGIDVVFAISPGRSIRYSSDSDFLALTEKLDAMTRLGVRHYALLFDDAPVSLNDPADRQRFKTAAAAHAFLVNRVWSHLIENGLDLVVCPSTYTDAWGDRGYLRELGKAVSKEVLFFWTGPDVVAPVITGRQALAWTNTTGRLPLIWDNYPANDFAPWRLFLGPWRHRNADLSKTAVGIVSNPMNEVHASMLPLLTLADYAGNPTNYDPESSIQNAAELLYGRSAARELQPFLEIYDPWVWGGHLFEPLFVPSNSLQVDEMEAGLVRLQEALTRLRELEDSSGSNLKALIEELDPIVAVTGMRLQKIKNSDRYVREGSYLVYDPKVDLYEAARTASSISVDGELQEWKSIAWRPLTARERQSLDTGAEAALLQDDQRLYLGVRVTDQQLAGSSGSTIGTRDHLTLVLEGVETNETGRLLVFLVPPDTRLSKPYEGMLDTESFMVRILGASEDLVFEPFLASLLEPMALSEPVEIASRTIDGGYSVEVAIPKSRFESRRLSLVVTGGVAGRRQSLALATRNYPVNRSTFVEITY